MPLYLNLLRVKQALLALPEWRSRVDAQGAMHLAHFLAAKRTGVTTGRWITHTESDDKAFCDDVLRVRPGPEPYYDPLAGAFRIATHHHSNVATARKKTFADKWKAARYRSAASGEEWQFADDYLDTLASKLLRKGGVETRIPVFDICAWIYRAAPFPQDADLGTVLERFKTEYHLSPQEFARLFSERALDGAEEPSGGYFQPYRTSDTVLLELVANPGNFQLADAVANAAETDRRSPLTPEDLAGLVTTGRKQIVIQGPPGTGKTHLAMRAAEEILRRESDKPFDSLFLDPATLDHALLGNTGGPGWTLTQFHPSYTYEDFVRGIASEVSDRGEPVFLVQDRTFVLLSRYAAKFKKSIVLIIDEINRGDLSKVLGELVYALEYRDRPVALQYAGRAGDQRLVVPSNLFIIGTMNTLDRSISHIDYAIRRRFDFVDCWPDRAALERRHEGSPVRSSALALYDACNALFPQGADQAVGHAYFLATNADDLARALVFQILPLLDEYRREGFLEDGTKLKPHAWPDAGLPLRHERPFELVQAVTSWIASPK